MSDVESDVDVEDESLGYQSQFDKIKKVLEHSKLNSNFHPRIKRDLIDCIRNLYEKSSNGDPNAFFAKVIKFLQEDVTDAMNKVSLPSDLYAITNISREVCNLLCAKLGETDPFVYEWNTAFNGDGETVESWCAGGLAQLKLMANKMVLTEHSPFKNDSLLEEPIIKETLKRQSQRNKLTKCEAKQPKEDDQTAKSETSLEKNIKKTLEIFNNYAQKKKFVNYFEFILNPHSFVQSVYNIHLMSFLVGERYVKMLVGNDKALYIGPISANINDEMARHLSLKEKRNHLVVSINMHQWEALVKKLNITESVLPEFVPKKVPLDELLNESEELILRIFSSNHEFLVYLVLLFFGDLRILNTKQGLFKVYHDFESLKN